jgi:TPP-dependent indolepyruvate ferredoxin oxidoreductase alpha subunit
MGEKKLMTGNEAVARGVWEGGLAFASAYPGTPSTEILENLVLYSDDLYAEWAPNEKVALESASGASMAGFRSMAAMKHVGVNVAADPLFTFAYTGVTGGMVLVSADDPGMHSSQNEQDNRNYAMAAKVLMLEPSDSAEAKAFAKLGLSLSERFDTPVMLRMTTRICHSKSLVELEARQTVPAVPYKKNIAKYVATPANARVMREKLIDRFAAEYDFSNGEAVSLGINRIEWAEGRSEEVGSLATSVAGGGFDMGDHAQGRKGFGTETSGRVMEPSSVDDGLGIGDRKGVDSDERVMASSVGDGLDLDEAAQGMNDSGVELGERVVGQSVGGGLDRDEATLGMKRSGMGTGGHIGVISAGVAYQYAKDVFGSSASHLKIGMSYPMPMDLIRSFAEKVDRLYIIEELDPYMEQQIRAAGIDCVGKEIIPEWDELNTDIVRKAVFGEEPVVLRSELTPVQRPPAMCAGCPHRGFFYGLSKRKNVVITGDIGCYTLGSAPPLSAMDSCFCMGGSISTGHGAAKALKESGSDARVVALIGDSTFLHSGVNSLMNVAYNGSNTISVILDNRITAMTGQQQNPGTGRTLTGAAAPEVNIPDLCTAIGIPAENIQTINPLDLAAVDAALDAAFATDAASVIITRWPCVLKRFSDEDRVEFDLTKKTCAIDQEKCTKCKLCTKTGCPAIYSGASVTINAEACTGCTVCQQVCPFGAISLQADPPAVS